MQCSVFTHNIHRLIVALFLQKVNPLGLVISLSAPNIRFNITLSTHKLYVGGLAILWKITF